MNDCYSCKAPIQWATSTKSGKLVPVDAEASPEGTVLLTEREGLMWATTLSKTAALSVPKGQLLFINHFVTCPSREQHRKKKP